MQHCEDVRFLCSTLEKLQPRVVSYEEQVTAIREQLADVLIDEEDWNQAAKTLAGIDLDSGDWPCSPCLMTLLTWLLPMARARELMLPLEWNSKSATIAGFGTGAALKTSVNGALAQSSPVNR